VQKEYFHSTAGVVYSASKRVQIPEFRSTGLPLHKWIGMKFVVFTTGASVHLEVYLDLEEGKCGGAWKLVHSFVDSPGAWPATKTVPADCKHASPPVRDGDVIWGRRKYCFLRADGSDATEVQWSKASIRQISSTKTRGNFFEEFWKCVNNTGTTPGSTMQSTTTITATATTTMAVTTQGAGSSGACQARAGNVLFATDAKCAFACQQVGVGTWPCTEEGPCDCFDSSATTAAPSTATTSAAPATTASNSGVCSGAWDQCGGKKWAGATCCVAGYTCAQRNEWYAQCRPQTQDH